MNDITSQLLEKYTLKLNEKPATENTFKQEQLDSYLKACAVLHCFVPESLSPLEPKYRHTEPRVLLYDHIINLAGGLAEGLFTLKLSVRQKALQELQSWQNMQIALKANPNHPVTELQKMWEDYLTSQIVGDPDKMGFKDLTNLSQLASWFEGPNKDFPTANRLAILLMEKSILSNFEHLLISNFTGRANELAELKNHIGLGKGSGLAEVGQKVLNWIFKEKKLILAINGPGGIGKSALVGHLLWDCAQLKKSVRPPFAYLPFDQPTLRIETPFTILIEIAAQLKLQLPQYAKEIDNFNTFVKNFRGEKVALNTRLTTADTRSERINRYHNADSELYYEFANLLHVITDHRDDMPVIFVFDTFEEVQYRDRESLASFWKMLEIIHNTYPPLKVIIAGRSVIADSRIEVRLINEMKLAQLSLEDSVSLLDRLGVKNPDIATVVAKQIGGNPLSLRLAANVITAGADDIGKKGIKDLNTTKWLFFQVDEELIQGQLYQRILNHIHNEDVRKLAHPGMVLRKISPEIVLYILAPICGLKITTIGEAINLFEQLKREHALVRTSESGILEYRPEIRRAMIRLLKQDKFAEVKRINEAAITYYSHGNSLISREEEIYHRLVLGDGDYSLLDNRWLPGIERSIIENMDEYSDEAKVWLASRFNLEVSRDIFNKASILDWERNITRKVKRALTELDINGALQLLSERQERSEASPLYALEAKTYILMRDLSKAKVVLEHGVENVSGSANRGRLAELFWLEAQLALISKNPESADERLSQAQEALKNASNPIAAIHVVCHRLFIDNLYQSKAAKRKKLLGQLNALCGRSKGYESRDVSFIFELAAYLLKDDYPVTASTLSYRELAAVDDISNMLLTENLRGLDEYRADWENEGDNLLFESLV